MKTICAVCTFVFISCATPNKTADIPKDNIVGYVGGEAVSYSDLKDGYISGSINNDYSLDDLQDFLPIYLDYRAKLKEAEESGYFENEKILSEYELYAKQAAYAYWMDQKIKPSKFNEFKSRYDTEVKSSHVLIAVSPTASPADTAAAYDSLIVARNKFLAGEATMDELNKEYSSEREGRLMGGDLPWFAVGTTVKQFEDQLYALEIGDISMPFRTQFGYHIVLLEDKRDRAPSRDISHIFVPRNGNPAKLDTAYTRLMNGEEWEAIVTEYTEDRLSMRNGGNIGWINYGARYQPAFIDLVMDLDPEVEITQPIMTPYGTHIFRIDSVQTFASEEAKDAFLMKELENTNSFQENNNFVIQWLRDEYRDVTYSGIHEQFQSYVLQLDTVMFSDLTVTESLSDSVIYEFADYDFTISDYTDFLADKYGNKPNQTYSENWFVAFKKAMVDENLADFTEMKFPEFEKQTDGYLRGLVVYQINEDSVWSTATVDTTILRDIYEENMDEYAFDQRYYYHLISSRQDSNLTKVIDFVNDGNSPDSIRANGFPVGVVSDSTGAFQGDPFTKLETMQPNTFSNLFEYNNRQAVFYLNEVLPARPMTFDEAFNRVMANYQPVREEKWLEHLRSAYAIKTIPENVTLNYNKENASSE